MKKAKFLTLVFSLFLLMSSCTDDVIQNIDTKSNSERNLISEEVENIDQDLLKINSNSDLIVTKAKFESKIILNTWRIKPDKLKDENLDFLYLRGFVFERSWYFNKYFSNLYALGHFVPREVRDGVGRFTDTPLNGGGGGLVPPLAVKFIASKSVNYRLIFKVENYQVYNRAFAVLVDEILVAYVWLNKDKEFIFNFKSSTTKELKIAVGGLYPNLDQEFVKTSEIKVENLGY